MGQMLAQSCESDVRRPDPINVNFPWHIQRSPSNSGNLISVVMLVATAGGIDCRFSEARASTILLIHTLGASKQSWITMFANSIARDLRGTDRTERWARSKFVERFEPV